MGIPQVLVASSAELGSSGGVPEVGAQSLLCHRLALARCCLLQGLLAASPHSFQWALCCSLSLPHVGCSWLISCHFRHGWISIPHGMHGLCLPCFPHSRGSGGGDQVILGSARGENSWGNFQFLSCCSSLTPLWCSFGPSPWDAGPIGSALPASVMMTHHMDSMHLCHRGQVSRARGCHTQLEETPTNFCDTKNLRSFCCSV